LFPVSSIQRRLESFFFKTVREFACGSHKALFTLAPSHSCRSTFHYVFVFRKKRPPFPQLRVSSFLCRAPTLWWSDSPFFFFLALKGGSLRRTALSFFASPFLGSHQILHPLTFPPLCASSLFTPCFKTQYLFGSTGFLFRPSD